MITVRKSEERGHFSYDWLDTYHTFSFNTYHDPNYHNFRSLRVINEDRVEPGAGFPQHGHRDMEIITFMLEGGLQHRDSMGNSSIIKAGQVQKMTAGSGIQHSEFNASTSDPAHLLQIWIFPEKKGLTPSYEERDFHALLDSSHKVLLGSRDGRDDSIVIHQDVNLYAYSLKAGTDETIELKNDRYGWFHVFEGELNVNGQPLRTGDGAAVSGETQLVIHADSDTRFLFFDLA